MAHQLLKTQRNEVFEVLKKAGLNPAEFVWDEVTPKFATDSRAAVSRLRPQADLNFYFTFDMLGGSHFARLSPAPGARTAEANVGVWADQLKNVAKWAAVLKAELSDVDLWEALKQLPPPASVTAIVKADDEPLGEDERAKFLEALAEVKRLAVKEIRDAGQLAAINAIVDRTEAQSLKLSRRDLWAMFIGNVMAMVMSGVLTVQNAQWMFAKLQALATWLVLASYSGTVPLLR